MNVETFSEHILPMLNKPFLSLPAMILKFGNNRTVEKHNGILVRNIRPFHVPDSFFLLRVIHRRFDQNHLVHEPESQREFKTHIIVFVLILCRLFTVAL